MLIVRCCLLVVALLLLVGPARAQDAENDAKREEARPIALEGFELLNAGKYDEAIAKLEEAEAIFHAPTHLLYIARARRELGELLTAHNTYVDILIEPIPNYAPAQFQEAKREAAAEAEALRAKIATLMIRVDGAPIDQVTVSLDGTPIPSARLTQPVAVTPGSHTVSATTQDAEDSQTVEGIVGQTKEVTLEIVAPKGTPEPDPDKPEAERSFPVLATVLLVLGGGALVAGTVTGVMTLSKASDIKDNCVESVCPPSEEEKADDAKLLGNVSTGMFIAGGVLAAAGVILLIVDPFNDSESARARGPAMAIEVGPGYAGLRGQF